MTKTITVSGGTDELGEPEEFSWDLFPIVDTKATLHLDQDGLPRIGTLISPGMIIVGRIGKTRKYDPERKPSALEIHGLRFEELRSRFGDMWVDRSMYADQDTSGVVQHASIESIDGRVVATVIIES